jgi:hypothetical protein
MCGLAVHQVDDDMTKAASGSDREAKGSAAQPQASPKKGCKPGEQAVLYFVREIGRALTIPV